MKGQPIPPAFTFTSSSKAIIYPLGASVLVISLALACSIAFCLIIGWIAIAVHQLLLAGGSSLYTNVHVRKDGHLIVGHTDSRRVTQYFDAHGNRVADFESSGKKKDTLDLISLAGPEYARQRDLGLRIDSAAFEMANAAHSPGNMYSYFVNNCDRRGFGYFVNYDATSNRIIGYLGRDGQQQSRPEGESQFDTRRAATPCILGGYYQGAFEPSRPTVSNPYEAKDVVISGGVPWLVNLRTATLKRLGAENDVLSASALSGGQLPNPPESEELQRQWTNWYAIRTTNRLILTNVSTHESKAWKLPQPVADEAMSFAFLDGGSQLLAMTIDDFQYPQAILRYTLYWITPAGEIEFREQVDTKSRSDFSGILLTAMRLSGTPWIDALAEWLVLPTLKTEPPEAHYLERVKAHLPVSLPWLLLNAVWAVSAIVLARRHGQAHHVPLTFGWYAFLALFGIPGYLGYRWHRHWPPRKIPTTVPVNGTEILVPA